MEGGDLSEREEWKSQKTANTVMGDDVQRQR